MKIPVIDGTTAVYGVLVAVVFFLVGYLFRKRMLEREQRHAHATAVRIIANAEKEAETKRREGALEARDELHRTRVRFEEETRERRQELLRLERRLEQREQNLDRKVDILDRKEKEIGQRERNVSRQEHQLKVRQKELDALLVEGRQKLQRISGLTKEEATKLLLAEFEKTLREEKAVVLKRVEEETKASAEKEARTIISSAIQRLASEEVAESTVSTVSLPDDEMKGRIIGREGRNIRAFETATGINLIIDVDQAT